MHQNLSIKFCSGYIFQFPFSISSRCIEFSNRKILKLFLYKIGSKLNFIKLMKSFLFKTKLGKSFFLMLLKIFVKKIQILKSTNGLRIRKQKKQTNFVFFQECTNSIKWPVSLQATDLDLYSIRRKNTRFRNPLGKTSFLI